MIKTAKQLLTSLDKGEYLGKGGVDQALKELEAIIVQAGPGTWVHPDDTDDLEWQGYVKGVQDYKDNLRQALYGKDENEDE